MEVKCSSWETRAEVTALTQVVELGVVATQASSGWILSGADRLEVGYKGKRQVKAEP